jgi:hypothetical protein
MKGAVSRGLVLAAALPLGAACASVFQPGVSRQELEDGGYLKYALFEYEREGTTYVWIPTWREKPAKRILFGGLVADAEADPDGAKSILEFRDGKLLRIRHLGTDRHAWVEALHEPGAEALGAEGAPAWREAILARRVERGMPLEAVLLSWGVPPLGSEWNPDVYMTAADLRRARRLWYPADPSTGRPVTVKLDPEGRVESVEDGPPADPRWRSWSGGRTWVW